MPKKNKRKISHLIGKPKEVAMKEIDFMTFKKDEADKFYDIRNTLRSQAFYINRKGENSFSEKRLVKILSKTLKISETRIKKIMAGNFTKREIKIVNITHKKRGYISTKQITKLYTPENFTLNNFFKVKKNRKLKIRNKIIIKAGIDIYYKSEDSDAYIKYDGKYVQVYRVPNLPLPFEFTNGGTKSLNEALEIFFGTVKEVIERPKERSGVLFFHFNYFKVYIFDLEKIERKDIKRSLSNKNKNKKRKK